jgi:signal transduction histidine kinase
VTAIAQLQEFEHSQNEQLRKINSELEELSESLELKVIDRTSELVSANIELQHAKEVAQEASKAKSSFLANMSHELRTPLNAILGFSQLIIEEENISDEVRDQLQIINSSGEHLLNLINSILVMSKIESGEQAVNLNEFSLDRLIATVKEILEFKSKQKKLPLIIENSTNIQGLIQTDELKLRQVLINLLNNAFKFTSSGRIVLRISTRQDDFQFEEDCNSQYLYFEVEDTGVGIASEDLENIFAAFFQSESGRQSHEGTGLGLAISRQFVRLMGGDISVSSVVGKGSNFEFNVLVNLVANKFADFSVSPLDIAIADSSHQEPDQTKKHLSSPNIIGLTH